MAPITKNSGFDEFMLSSVIEATALALGDIDQVGNRVSYLASALPSVNQSESGRRLARIFTDWTGDFNTIRGALDGLNQKAIALRAANLNVADETSVAAK